GDALDRWIAYGEERRGPRFAFPAVGLSLLAAAAALPIVAHLSPVVVPRGKVAWAVVAGLAIAIAVLACYRRRDGRPVLAIATSMAVLECFAVVIAAPIVRPLT